jgi:hypothetical protein
LLMQLRSEILGTVRTSVEVADSAWLTSRRCEAWLQVLDRVISYTPNFSAALVLLRVNMHAHNSIQFTSRNSFKSTPYQFISTICKAIANFTESHPTHKSLLTHSSDYDWNGSSSVISAPVCYLNGR